MLFASLVFLENFFTNAPLTFTRLHPCTCKQEEVLAEMHAGVPVEVNNLDKWLQALQELGPLALAAVTLRGGGSSERLRVGGG